MAKTLADEEKRKMKGRLRDIRKILRGSDSEEEEQRVESERKSQLNGAGVKNTNYGNDNDDDYYDVESGQEESDSSEDVQLGFKKAIGIDPDEVKNFRQHNNPENGSQFLLNAMLERKSMPKVVVADPVALQAKIDKKIAQTQMKLKQHKAEALLTEGETNGSGGQVEEGEILEMNENGECSLLSSDANCNVTNYEQELSESLEALSIISPDEEWKATTLEKLSMLRAKVNYWRHLIEQRHVLISPPEYITKWPGEINEWAKFFFGYPTDKQENMSKIMRTSPKITKDTTLNSFYNDYLKQFFGIVEDQQEAETAATKSDNHLDEEESSSKKKECTSVSEDNSIYFPTGFDPRFTIILNIPQRTIERLISYHVHWIRLNNKRFISNHQCQWIYSLIVCLQTPLEAPVMADLRDIAKTCIIQRKIIGHLMNSDETRKTRPDKEVEHVLQMYLNSLNLFVVLVGSYFVQKDLLEEL